MNFATEDGVVFGHTWPTFCPFQNRENVEGMCKDSAWREYRSSIFTFNNLGNAGL
jgi:hypothetical protein